VHELPRSGLRFGVPGGGAAQNERRPGHLRGEPMHLLGVLDTNLSLAVADANMAQSTRQAATYTGLAILAISSLCGLFVWHVVRSPLAAFKAGTERLCSGELGYQLDASSGDELADLAQSFNTMSLRLRQAREEIDGWTKTLEVRVEEKTRQLSAAHEQMLHVEKMASIGKLSAVVAHEINNPLAGILTYAKLLKKRFSPRIESQKEIFDTLDIIEGESRRCGEIVKNLMTFARKTPISFEPADLNAIVERCAKLVKHRLALANIELNLYLEPDVPKCPCDAGQIAQVALAIIMNAIEAMPRGGILSLKTYSSSDASSVNIEVRDNGAGMPPEVLRGLFEPFFTTKEGGHSLGLGLAVGHSIVERHSGQIKVESRLGLGSTFTIQLPLHAVPAGSEPAVLLVRNEVIESGRQS
jgi:two-component system, NtrC family, sensor kinase